MLLIKELEKILPIEKVKVFHTRSLSFQIYATMTCLGCKSFVEIGTGWGGTALLAGLALKETNPQFGFVKGIDRRGYRTEYARKLLDDHGVRHDIWEGNYQDYEIRDGERYDSMFLDAGWRDNQQTLDKFGPLADKVIFLHDVHGELKFPDGFTPVYMPGIKAVMAVRGNGFTV